MTEDRYSKAHEPEILQDPEALARREAQNTLAQYRAVTEMVENFLQPDRPFKSALPTCYTFIG
jgi:hypothetical protein